jgi:hypothetical protein
MAGAAFPKMVYRAFISGHWSGTPDQLADRITSPVAGQPQVGECRGSQDGSPPSQYLSVNGKSLEYRTVNSAAEQSALPPGVWYLDEGLTQLAN